LFMVKMFGFKRALARVGKINVGLINMTIPHKLMLTALEKRLKGTFARGGDPRWKKLSRHTLPLREVNRRNQPNIDRGNILRALTRPRSRYASHKVFKKSFRLAIKKNLTNNGAFYPNIVDQGATVRNGWGKGITIHIPARPFMHLIDRDRRKFDNIMHLYLEGLVRA